MCSDGNGENWDPSDPADVANIEVNWDELGSNAEYDPEYDDETEKKWEHLRKPIIPEPFFEDLDYTPKEGKRLVDKFAASGLQVIVKMASIELTPDKDKFPVGGWHVSSTVPT